MISDQAYPATNGDSLYISEAGNNIFKLSGVSSPNGAITLDNNYGNSFLFLISMAIDASILQIRCFTSAMIQDRKAA